MYFCKDNTRERKSRQKGRGRKSRFSENGSKIALPAEIMDIIGPIFSPSHEGFI